MLGLLLKLSLPDLWGNRRLFVMSELKTNHRIFILMDGTLDEALEGFITERRSRGLSPRTIDFYIEKLSRFRKYSSSTGLSNLDEISSADIRLYLLKLAETCSNGGVHAHYRALRSFFNWWDEENDDYNSHVYPFVLRRINLPQEAVAIRGQP